MQVRQHIAELAQFGVKNYQPARRMRQSYKLFTQEGICCATSEMGRNAMNTVAPQLSALE